MLVLIATLIGFTLFNFGLASRVQQLPNRQDTLETRFSGLEATLGTASSNLETTSQCMAANVGWVSTRTVILLVQISLQKVKFYKVSFNLLF